MTRLRHTPDTVLLPEPGAVPAPPRPRNVDELKKGFEDWLLQRGKSATTRRLYLRNVAEFLDWLNTAPPLAGEKADAIVTRYYAALEIADPGNSGNLRRTTAARAFLTYSGAPPEAYRSETGPYRGLRRGQGARYLDIEESLSVLETVRDRGLPQEVAVVGLLLLSEMSPRLVCSLTVADLARLDDTGQQWRVDRGNQHWEFAVPSSIARVLLDLGRERPNLHSPLFVDGQGQALTRQSLDHIMKELGAAAGVPELAAYRLTMSRSKRSGHGLGWDALAARRGGPRRRAP
ncbi:MAG: hypothetical protein ABIJ09_20385 [Pseudomonadota bacterium]